MELKRPQAWQRHQLAAIERMKADISRYTDPVIHIMGICSLVYLATWCPIWIFWAEGGAPWLPLLVATLSGIVVVITAPVFALAVGIERYLCRRLQQLQAPNS